MIIFNIECYTVIPFTLSKSPFVPFYPLLLQHYDRRSQFSTALEKIDEAISHTPTVIDLYSAKVRSYIRQSFQDFLSLSFVSLFFKLSRCRHVINDLCL